MKKLDLHGMKHQDAKDEVVGFIEDLWGTYVNAEIVTGHSKIMRDIVVEVLEEYKLVYFIGGY